MNEKIKNCPFCGSGSFYNRTYGMVRCSNPDCNLVGPKGVDKGQAIYFWDSIVALKEDEIVVPEEPTFDMEDNGKDTMIFCAEVGEKIMGASNAAKTYDNMIAARPRKGETNEQ